MASRRKHKPLRQHIWVCAACGRQSWDRDGKEPLQGGWDESCMLRAVLCKYPQVNGKWEAIRREVGG